MTETILANEPAIRLVFFLGIFALMVLWEFVTPRRERSVSRWVRWPSNLGIVAFNAPLMAIFSVDTRVLGVPLLYLYLFLAWGALIAFFRLAARPGGRRAWPDAADE